MVTKTADANADSQNGSSGRWEVMAAESIGEIEAIRPVWDRLQCDESHPVPNADIDKYVSFIEASAGDVRPCVLLLKRDGCPAAMLVAWIEKHRLKFTLGYKTLFEPALRTLTVVYGGVLGRPDEEACSVLAGEMLRRLRSRDIDVLRFNYLRTDTIFYRTIRKTRGFGFRGHVSRVDEHWCLALPKGMDEFYRSFSRKRRYNLRRVVRLFERDYSDKSVLAQYSTEAEVDEFLHLAAELSSKTYQTALGVGVAADEQTTTLMKAAARHGWFHSHVLFAGDVPCAFQLGLRYKGVYYMVNMGHDPAFQSRSPGTVLFFKVLESLCDDNSVSNLDFYFGDARYKRQYGTDHWPEACVYVLAARPHLILLNMLRVSVVYMNAGLKFVVSRIGVGDWIKRKWRNSLQNAQEEST